MPPTRLGHISTSSSQPGAAAQPSSTPTIRIGSRRCPVPRSALRRGRPSGSSRPSRARWCRASRSCAGARAHSVALALISAISAARRLHIERRAPAAAIDAPRGHAVLELAAAMPISVPVFRRATQTHHAHAAPARPDAGNLPLAARGRRGGVGVYDVQREQPAAARAALRHPRRHRLTLRRDLRGGGARARAGPGHHAARRAAGRAARLQGRGRRRRLSGGGAAWTRAGACCRSRRRSRR